nr:MAG TPA: hypothetical protein [Caudoviricetes sp.]
MWYTESQLCLLTYGRVGKSRSFICIVEVFNG